MHAQSAASASISTMGQDAAPARRISFAEWFNFVQRRLGRLEAGMNALKAGILTPRQGEQLDLAMERWESDHPQFKTAHKPQDGDLVQFDDGKTDP